MAEPVGLASGVLAFSAFAFQATITLHDFVQSFRSHSSRVRDLQNELQALVEVLSSLSELLESTTDIDLSTLSQPLLQCGRACKAFQEELKSCSSHSDSNRTSFRDWAKLRYIGDDIDGFRRSLSVYKATISIALNDANLRRSAVTAERLLEYQDLIKTTSDDLEMRLESIDEKLKNIVERNLTDSKAAELQCIKDEQLSTQNCLKICAQLSEHIEKIQTRLPQIKCSSSGTTGQMPEIFLNDGIQGCKASLDQATAKLEAHMQDIVSRILEKAKTSMTSNEVMDLARLQEELATTRHCRNICSQATQHMREDVAIIDNHATGEDTLQLVASTNGKPVHGKNRGYGSRIGQFGGYCNDESLQEMSRNFSSITFRNHGKENIQSEDKAKSEGDIVIVQETSWANYGPGTKLAR